MAHRFEKGTHLYFPFKNGLTVQDSQCKPRYYLTKESLQNNLSESGYSEVVEYAPVVHGKWEINKEFGDYECSVCGRGDVIAPYFKRLKMHYCPNCGANMELED